MDQEVTRVRTSPTALTLSAALVLLTVPIVLATFAWPQFVAGVPAAGSETTVTSTVTGYTLSQAAYEQASRDLKNTPADDGFDLVSLAEVSALAAWRDKKPDRLAVARQLTIQGISRAPSNPQGWTLLCAIVARSSRMAGARCMDTALYVGPFDWFTARHRALLGTEVWPLLSPDTKDTFARRLHLMWDDTTLYAYLWDVWSAPNGAAVLTTAFAGDKDGLRRFNRWLIRRTMCDARCYPPVI
jgi:hypothetical protein